MPQIKIQRNPSSGKVLFDTATHRVQVIRPHLCWMGGSSLFLNTRRYLAGSAVCSTIWHYDCYAHIYGIAVDKFENIYIAGHRTGDKSVWKLNALGEKIWDYDTGADALGIAVDYSGNVYITGDDVNVGTEEEPEWASIWKLSSNGNLIRTFGFGSDDFGRCITICRNSNIYVGSQPIFVGGTALNNSVWKFNSAGNLKWAFGTDDDIRGIAVDDSGKVYAVGDREREQWNEVDYEYANIWKLSNKGNLLWWYDTESLNLRDIVIDSSGDIYVTGTGGAGGNEVWKINSAGILQWSHDLGGIFTGSAVALTPNEGFLLVGEDTQNLTFLRASDGVEVFKCNPAFDPINCVITQAPLLWIISGVVKENGTPLAGVAMNNLANNPETDEDGFYAGTVIVGWSGTVTPQKAGYTFSPTERAYSDVQSDKINQNYAAIAD